MAGTIAVAVDGTEASRAALEFAVRLARDEGARLAGVFVIDSGWADFIGNDWQSSRNARQGFLDYVRADQERFAEAARKQFERAAESVAAAGFSVLVGDPAESLAQMMEEGAADALVAGREVFRACGRPGVRRLPKILAKRVRQRLFIR